MVLLGTPFGTNPWQRPANHKQLIIDKRGFETL
jgi:hypothetical protein